MDIMDYEFYLRAMSDEENFYYDRHVKNTYDYTNDFDTYLKTLKHNNLSSPFLFAVQNEDHSFLTIKGKIFKEGYKIGVYKHHRFSPEFAHNHDFFEIIYAYKGGYTQYIYDKKHEMKEGTICIVPPKMIHTVHLDDNSIVVDILVRSDMFDRNFFHFLQTNRKLNSFFIKGLYCNNYTSYILFNITESKKLRKIILEMAVEFNSNNKYSSTILNGMLLIFLGLLMQNSENTIQLSGTKENNHRIPLIMDYLEREYNTVTLDSLANHFNYNKSYMSKLIKKVTGYNFSDIIQDIKIKKACELLTNTNLSINELANHLGYTDVSYFSSTFKKVKGVLPSQYKNKMLNKQ